MMYICRTFLLAKSDSWHCQSTWDYIYTLLCVQPYIAVSAQSWHPFGSVTAQLKIQFLSGFLLEFWFWAHFTQKEYVVTKLNFESLWRSIGCVLYVHTNDY